MEVEWGVAASDDMPWVYWLRSCLVVCKVMGRDLDRTSEHEEWFEGGRRIVYKESVVGVWWFPFLLSILVLLYSKASYHFETALTLVFFWFPRNEYRALCFALLYHIIVTNLTSARPRPLQLRVFCKGFRLLLSSATTRSYLSQWEHSPPLWRQEV
jgi:hypothetical protein